MSCTSTCSWHDKLIILLRIRFDKIDGFIRVSVGTRYLVLFGLLIYAIISHVFFSLLGAQIWVQNWVRFFTIFSALHHQFSLILHRIAAWDDVQHLTAETSGPNWGQNEIFQDVVGCPVKLACSLCINPCPWN